MPRFTVRVELHGAENQPAKYTALHEAMGKKGFRRTISFTGDGDDTKYELPPAEYNRTPDAALTVANVLEEAKAAASTVQKEFSVLVTQTEVARGIFGLKKVN
jgi:hypothetical protein